MLLKCYDQPHKWVSLASWKPSRIWTIIGQVALEPNREEWITHVYFSQYGTNVEGGMQLSWSTQILLWWFLNWGFINPSRLIWHSSKITISATTILTITCRSNTHAHCSTSFVIPLSVHPHTTMWQSAERGGLWLYPPFQTIHEDQARCGTFNYQEAVIIGLHLDASVTGHFAWDLFFTGIRNIFTNHLCHTCCKFISVSFWSASIIFLKIDWFMLAT